jgi:putative toxin-antitoxin system antitoxin component (TIGR02293 family)
MDPIITDMLSVKRKTGGGLDVAKHIERGLSPNAIEKVKTAYGLNDTEISSLLGVSTKTISRTRTAHAKRLSLVVGDRLFRLAKMFAFATQVLEDRDAAREWLRSPQFGLNNAIPLDLMNTEVGAKEVEDLLGRIEYGVLP